MPTNAETVSRRPKMATGTIRCLVVFCSSWLRESIKLRLLFHVVLLIRQINRSSQPPPAWVDLGHLGVTKAHQVPPLLYPLESKKSSSSRVPPSLLGNFPFMQNNSKTHRLPGCTKIRNFKHGCCYLLLLLNVTCYKVRVIAACDEEHLQSDVCVADWWQVRKEWVWHDEWDSIWNHNGRRNTLLKS